MKVISYKILPVSLLAIATIVPISLKAQSDFAHSEYDQLQAFGFATCDSRTDSNPSIEKVMGGGAYTYEDAMALLNDPASGKKVKVLTADKVYKDDVIKNAIKDNDIVILDGSKGDFVIKKYITIQNQGSGTGCNNKTILGINNARLVTEWYVTPDVLAILKEADVESASTNKGTGGTLPNGVAVDEEADSTLIKVNLKAPLSTLKTDEVSVKSDGMRKQMVESSTVPVEGFMVKIGLLFIDATFFFVSAAPFTIKAEEKVRPVVSAGCVLADREREVADLSPLRA